MEAVPVKIVPRGYGETERQDAWWIEPILVFVVFSSFLAYGTWAAMQNAHFEFGPYLSPFYSPLLFGTSHHAWFGPRPGWFPEAVFYPALLILPVPGLFRLTCYYYRGAYYKAFWQDPVSCTVGEPRGTSYWGERWFPLVLQNVHRYFAYLAVLFIVILSYDVWLATEWANPNTGEMEFGIGVGTLVMLGGRRDEVSKAPISEACYRCASALNGRHMMFAWLSLFSVGLTDAYIRLCSLGVIWDFRIL
jgi:hypothetical protein